MMRWKGLLGFLAKKPLGWDSMLKVYEKGEMQAIMKNPYREVKKATSANKVFQRIDTAEPHVMVSFPKELY